MSKPHPTIKKSTFIIATVGVLVLVSSYLVYAHFFSGPAEVNQGEAPTPTASPIPSASAAPSLIQSPSATPSASSKPVNSKLFKIISPSTWDTQKSTQYFFAAHASTPIKTTTIKFADSEFELTPNSTGTFFKAIDINVGKTVITATAVAESGKTEVQTYTVTKSDTLSQIDPKLIGVQCDGAKLDECRNYSGYSPGNCVKYTLYRECLRTKCDVNTLAKDPSCQSQNQ